MYRTATHIYAQVVVDSDGTHRRARFDALSRSEDYSGEDTKTDAAKKVGALIAKICLEKKI